MKDTKLIRVISGFSKNELLRLKDFVYSPFFNTNENVQKLCEFVINFEPSFDSNKLTEEQAFKYIFKEKSFKKDAVTKLISRLFKLLEEYIAIKEFWKKDLNPEMALLTYYNVENFVPNFRGKIKTIKKKLNDQPLRDEIYYWHLFHLEAEESKYLATREDDGTGGLKLQETTNQLDTYYLLSKLKLLCTMKNRQRTVIQEYDFVLMDEILNFLPNSQFIKNPSVRLWFRAFKLLINPKDSTSYFDFKSSLLEVGSTQDHFDHRNLFTFLENSARGIFQDTAEYYKELFDLYSRQIVSGILYTDGFLIPQLFRNVILVALKLNKIKWTEKFIKENKDKLYPDFHDREDIYYLCLGYVSFEKQAFKETLDYLNQIKYNNLYTKMDERRLRLKTYLELDYRDLFEDLINSFRRFLTWNKKNIPDPHIQANRNFINIAYSIYKTTRLDDMRIKDIDEQITQTGILPERQWLVNKLISLK